MIIPFHKYHGTGNDFVIVDNRQETFPRANFDFVKSICQRHYGVGADGLILIEKDEFHDFYMRYYNSDGRLSSFCGNGSRCTVHLAEALGIFSKQTTFRASDGIHEASTNGALVSVKMNDVSEWNQYGEDYILDTGSPHYVRFTDDLDLSVIDEARVIRYSEPFRAKGVNVNFVRIKEGMIHMRTYERGVEAETQSCGTGVTAAAIVYAIQQKGKDQAMIQTLGGTLSVSWKYDGVRYHDIYLTGPAQQSFYGHLHYFGS